jgi:hypothetical protein
MKPIDLQVNILKSTELLHEKGWHSQLQAQNMHQREELKKEMLQRDTQVAENKEKDGIQKDPPEKEGGGQGARGESSGQGGSSSGDSGASPYSDAEGHFDARA